VHRSRIEYIQKATSGVVHLPSLVRRVGFGQTVKDNESEEVQFVAMFTKNETEARRCEVSLDDNSSISVIVSSVDLNRASRSCCSVAESTSLCSSPILT
jgi:hypothetical protein